MVKKDDDEIVGNGKEYGLWFDLSLKKTPDPSFLLIFTWRLFNALTINTFFQADEYWQALEPAHSFVFGYGYLTWEWQLGLRSYLHPLLYMFPYWIVKFFKFDYDYVLVGPKLINAIIASLGDYYLYQYIFAKFNDKKFAKLVSYMSLLSAWNWYCWTRSFSNSLELTLTITALYYFEIFDYFKCLLIAAFTCLIRPTNAIIWLYTLPPLFFKYPKYIIVSIFMGLTVFVIDIILNYKFYGSLKFPLLAFFKFNVSDSLSSFYGVSRLDFYFFQAIPILLLNYLPFFIYGILKSPFSNLKGLLLTYVLVFTMIPHKEFRFIYPIMPILLIYSAFGIIQISKRLSSKLMKFICIQTILTSILIGFYFTQYHEVGELQLPTLLRNRIIAEDKGIIDVGFLTPCHSTPFQSHFHLQDSEVNIWFLTCEPPLSRNIQPGSSVDTYMDESDYFYDNPILFIKENFPEEIDVDNVQSEHVQWPHKWPHYIVMFEDLWGNNQDIRDYLGGHYVIVENIWNSHGHWDSRREGDLLVLKYSK